MTKLLLVRHGESQANLKDVFAGYYDIDLTERGLEQAQCTARFIKENYAVDVIYSSDLRRACQTAKPIADTFGLPIIPEKEMREISAGDWEGVSFASLKNTHAEAFRIWITDLGNAVCPNGESTAQMAERILNAVTRIAKENDGKTVVITTHATPIRALQCHVLGKPLREIQQLSWVSNASVTEVDYENGVFTLIKTGQDAHLAELRTTLPDDV